MHESPIKINTKVLIIFLIRLSTKGKNTCHFRLTAISILKYGQKITGCIDAVTMNRKLLIIKKHQKPNLRVIWQKHQYIGVLNSSTLGLIGSSLLGMVR